MPPPCPVALGFSGETTSVWWTDGGPRVPATRLAMSSLPDAAGFAAMLGHLAPTESAP